MGGFSEEGVDPVDVPVLAQKLVGQIEGLNPELITKYLEEIKRWNEQIGLVSKRKTALVLEKLVRKSAQLLYFVEEHGVFKEAGNPPKVIDIGSGGGFPGLLWKILRPDLELLLLERKKKKATFLERVVSILNLGGAEILEKNASEASSLEQFRERFDIALAMAVGPPAEMAPQVEGFVRPGGYYCTVRPSQEKDLPERVGKELRLKITNNTETGLFCLYLRERRDNNDSG